MSQNSAGISEGSVGKGKLKESQGIQKVQKDLGVTSKEGHCCLQGMEHAGGKRDLGDLCGSMEYRWTLWAKSLGGREHHLDSADIE